MAEESMLKLSGTFYKSAPEYEDYIDMETFNIEGTSTGRIEYAPSSETPATEAVRLRSQIDELIRQVTELHNLRFIHFVIDCIIRRTS
jgi:hypothetical protein